MRITTLPVLTLLSLAAGNAGATQISFTTHFNVLTDIPSYTNDGGAISANYNQVILASLPGFDSSLGTLNNASISLASEYANRLRATAVDDRATCQDFFCLFTDVETAITLHNDVTYTAILANAPSTTLSRSFTLTQHCSASSDGEQIACATDDQNVGSFSDAFDLSAYSLSSFSDATVILGFQFQSILHGECQNDLGDHCEVRRDDPFWAGDVTAIYDYTALITDPTDPPDPTSVPEPASLLLLATGLGGLALRRRPRNSLI